MVGCKNKNKREIKYKKNKNKNILYNVKNECRWKEWGGWRERKNRGCHEIITKIVTISSSPPLRGTLKRVSTGEKSATTTRTSAHIQKIYDETADVTTIPT
jgi:hypothetical protein